MRRKFRYYFKKKSQGLRSNPRIRTVSKTGGGGFKDKPNHCEVCGAVTREGKPFCPDHVDHHPYIQRLLGQLEGKALEEDRIGLYQKKEPEERLHGDDLVAPDSLTIKDILTHLKHYGTRTVRRLARALILEPAVVDHYVRYLHSKGMVELSRTNRGATTVKLKESRRRLRRRNPESFLPAPKNSFLAKLDTSRQPLFPITSYVDLNAPASQALLPATLAQNAPTVSMYGVKSLPRGAANFELLARGNSPLIIVPEGKEWKVKTQFHARLFDLIQNLDDINAWEQLYIDCNGLPGQGCKGSFDIYLVSQHNERYKLLDVTMDLGDESGRLLAQHIGGQGKVEIRVPESIYRYSRTESGIERVPFLLPVLLYR